MASLPKFTKRNNRLPSKQFYKIISQKSHQGLPQIIQSYKAAVSRQCRILNQSIIWQSRFYDHVIKNEQELYYIQEYIKNNPKNWQTDLNNR
jgi:hypothetical protein